MDDGTLVDGVVDAAFREEGRWTVIDYKTDDPARIAPETLLGYQRQVSLYMRGIEGATGQAATGLLVFF